MTRLVRTAADLSPVPTRRVRLAVGLAINAVGVALLAIDPLVIV